MTHTITAGHLEAAHVVQTGLFHLAQGLVNDAQPLISQGRAEWISDGYVQIVSLTLQANDLMNMRTPAAYPTYKVQREGLASSVAQLGRELIRLPQVSFRFLVSPKQQI